MPNKFRGWWISRRSKFTIDVKITTRCPGLCSRRKRLERGAGLYSCTAWRYGRGDECGSPAFGGQPPLPGGPRRLRICHGGELLLVMIQEEMSVNEAEAVKTEGQVKVGVEEEMSLTRVEAVTEGQVDMLLVSVAFSINVEFRRSERASGWRVEGSVFRVFLVCH